MKYETLTEQLAFCIRRPGIALHHESDGEGRMRLAGYAVGNALGLELGHRAHDAMESERDATRRPRIIHAPEPADFGALLAERTRLGISRRTADASISLLDFYARDHEANAAGIRRSDR